MNGPIKDLSYTEIADDREASVKDIADCEAALRIGVTTYSGGSVQDRIEGNRRIIETIDAELARRSRLASEAAKVVGRG